MAVWCVAPLEMNEGNSLGGKGTIDLLAAVPKRPYTPPSNLFSAAGRIMSMKNSNDAIGNRTCDIPACSAVPQPTAPPAACPKSIGQMKQFKHSEYRKLKFSFLSEPHSTV